MYLNHQTLCTVRAELLKEGVKLCNEVYFTVSLYEAGKRYFAGFEPFAAQIYHFAVFVRPFNAVKLLKRRPVKQPFAVAHPYVPIPEIYAVNVVLQACSREAEKVSYLIRVKCLVIDLDFVY